MSDLRFGQQALSQDAMDTITALADTDIGPFRTSRRRSPLAGFIHGRSDGHTTAHATR
jgi:hypothetical protein